MSPKITSVLDSTTLDSVQNKMVNLGFKEARKNMQDADFLQALATFQAVVGDMVKKLDLEVKRLKAMHASQKAIS